ncbi:hypothetical protein M378DRAFT_159216 [Amanita muscaria Koide BX008]|uniref:Uncharacterized protein n=1 Tax=Amanita muscaria (strain Koide BX008) TaxID=946122 RepID=A0A0C2X1G2_AMAMK|nr:hypothetical protein M378DRAFT_159216 [Amanita muscaria Koide BX008]
MTQTIQRRYFLTWFFALTSSNATFTFLFFRVHVTKQFDAAGPDNARTREQLV